MFDDVCGVVRGMDHHLLILPRTVLTHLNPSPTLLAQDCSPLLRTRGGVPWHRGGSAQARQNDSEAEGQESDVFFLLKAENRRFGRGEPINQLVTMVVRICRYLSPSIPGS